MKIPYVDLGKEYESIKEEILDSIESVLSKGGFILGEEVQKFENAISREVGTKFAVGVNSGTDALILTLRACGIGKGDEVITVANSFIATVAAIEMVQATPVLVDVLENQNINYELIEENITRKTKAIIPVHLGGRPAQMDKINEIADKYNLVVIEDCSQAIKAKFMSKNVGTFGLAGCFSLHPLKNLGAYGDAGVIVTSDKKLYEELILLRNHGLKNRNECDLWGYNSRLDEIQAAILNVKLKYLEKWTQHRRENARYYIDNLKELPIVLPVESEDEYAVYHAFVIQTSYRDELQEHLLDKGIDAKVHYPIPIHQQDAAHKRFKSQSLPITEKQTSQILSLPVNPTLDKIHLDLIIAEIKKFINCKLEVVK
ncbi:DegT/DnrJ/EryC1/StrS family aminotransferase [Evansella clarkii]|uniref:DegT/DnrJ/EryC1/StrS family aminotransferase n=1 Tax=Evansella clarkii TaxID=79879 RepID=UPI000B445926|nr:DegT/DnrJ/EryC1/StrS family aminotransferase [Evansella clarkii]